MSASDTGSLHIIAYCKCGGKLNARSTPPAGARLAHEAFRQVHTGPGHAPCDPQTARRARAKAAA